MKKKSNNNDWSEIYKACNHHKYSQLTNVQGKAEVKSNIKNFFNNYKLAIIITLTVLLTIFIYVFRTSPITILSCIGFVLLLFVLIIFSSTYKLTLDENNFTLRMNFQTTAIATNDLATIYLSRDKVRFFGIPIYTYVLNIIYIVKEYPETLSLPVIMTNKKSIKNLFSHIETKKIKDDEEEIKKQNRDKSNRIVIITIIAVSIIVLLVASIIVAVFYSKHRSAIDFPKKKKPLARKRKCFFFVC